MEATLRISEAVERLNVVFAEVPGTQLSLVDASRLAGLERAVCREVLDALTDSRFLARGRNGLFVRRTSDSPMG
jgi:DNA-binding GntR family transcriptional regulator